MKSTLTEEMIRRHVEEESFKRGQRYYRNDALSLKRRQGNTIKARCSGSYRNAYQVHVELDKTKNISSARCSCPIGSNGHCKHVAALLLSWINSPKDFHTIQKTDDALEARDKSELITLIKHMLKHQPDLEILLETPLPKTKVPRKPVSPEIYYRQAYDCIMDMDESETSVSLYEILLSIKEIGDEFKNRRDFSSATAVYEGLIRAISDTYHLGYDEEGDVDEIMENCTADIQECFTKLDNPSQRENILRTLLTAYDCDFEYCGNLGDSIPEFMDTNITNDERQMVTRWLDRKIRKQKDPYNQELYEEFKSKLNKKKPN